MSETTIEAGAPFSRPIPSLGNVAVIALQLSAYGGFALLATRIREGWALVPLALGFGLLMNSVYSIIHEAEHGILFPDRRVNDSAGIAMALLFPAPFHLIRQGHLGHHLRNRSDDEAFDFWFDGENPVWKRMQLYGILTGFYWLVVALSNAVVLLFPFLLQKNYFRFDRPSAAFMEALNPSYRWMIRAEAAGAILLHSAIVILFRIPPFHWLAMYAGFGWSWSAMQYVHHWGTERDVVRGARNLRIWGPIDALLLHHNWHGAHHRHPTIPWTGLPDLGRSEDPERKFLPLAYLRMWGGPRYTDEHVENRYAGRIIR